MFEFKIIVFFFILAYWLGTVSADCSITIEGGAPTFTKKFGKKTLAIPGIGRTLLLKAREKVNAYCSSGISLRSDYQNYISESEAFFHLSIQCSNSGKILYEVLDPPTYSRRDVSRPLIFLSCMQGAEGLFESNKPLDGCTNYTSLGFGTVLEGNRQMVIAGICFDFDTLSSKYVKYLAHRSKYELTYEIKHNKSGIHITDLDTPMESLEVFFSGLKKHIFEVYFDAEQKANPLLNAHKYEFLNIVQDTQFQADILNIEYLLNTVWWRNFRLGSWTIFLNALRKRTEVDKYIVYTGTSGKLRIPSALNCKQDEVFQIGVFDVPEIIWAYVKPRKANKLDEFVVFGYNTPFYSADNETITCKDICNEIDWLNNDSFNKIRLLPAFGVMHCCRPQEIASQLDVFPEEQTSPATTDLPSLKMKIEELEDWKNEDYLLALGN